MTLAEAVEAEAFRDRVKVYATDADEKRWRRRGSQATPQKKSKISRAA